jgi:hypothetical protein
MGLQGCQAAPFKAWDTPCGLIRWPLMTAALSQVKHYGGRCLGS